jgi:hypothetical protein
MRSPERSEDEHRAAIEVVEAGARDLGAEELRQEPNLDSLQLARADELFDLFEMVLPTTEDDHR